MKAGDRVKLTDKGARGFSAQYTPRRKPVDWFARQGVLIRFNSYYAFVLWDGLRSVSQLPVMIVEPVREADRTRSTLP
jgi:hypothetical protein